MIRVSAFILLSLIASSCEMDVETSLIYYPSDPAYGRYLLQALEREDFQFAQTEQGGISYSYSDATEFEAIRMEVDEILNGTSGGLLLSPDLVSAYEALLQRQGVNFLTHETDGRTEILYSWDDAELAEQLYAEIWSRASLSR